MSGQVAPPPAAGPSAASKTVQHGRGRQPALGQCEPWPQGSPGCLDSQHRRCLAPRLARGEAAASRRRSRAAARGAGRGNQQSCCERACQIPEGAVAVVSGLGGASRGCGPVAVYKAGQPSLHAWGARGGRPAARRGEPAGPARGRPKLQAACAQGEAASRTLVRRQSSARGGGGDRGQRSCPADECRQSKPIFRTAQIKSFIQELRF